MIFSLATCHFSGIWLMRVVIAFSIESGRQSKLASFNVWGEIPQNLGAWDIQLTFLVITANDSQTKRTASHLVGSRMEDKNVGELEINLMDTGENSPPNHLSIQSWIFAILKSFFWICLSWLNAISIGSPDEHSPTPNKLFFRFPFSCNGKNYSISLRTANRNFPRKRFYANCTQLLS